MNFAKYLRTPFVTDQLQATASEEFQFMYKSVFEKTFVSSFPLVNILIETSILYNFHLSYLLILCNYVIILYYFLAST